VSAGGIGSVASSARARGRGLPTLLLREAQARMRREGVAVGFLFTGIPRFYERLGWRSMHQPQFAADASQLASAPGGAGYRIRRAHSADVPTMLSVYRGAIRGATGAIPRTERSWRDAQVWLGEDAAGCLVALAEANIVAYVRARSRAFGYNVLEAEHRPGHAAALAPLLRRIGRRGRSLGQNIIASAPDDSMLAAILGSLPSTIESGMPGLAEPVIGYPTMMRIMSLDALVGALLPALSARAPQISGPSFTLGLRAHDGQALTMHIGAGGAAVSRRAPAHTLGADATLASLLGQCGGGEVARPRPRADVRSRLDALFPATALHFWNSDRI
jgi:hypothetical protein